METSLPTPMTARVYVNLPEGNIGYWWLSWWLIYNIMVNNDGLLWDIIYNNPIDNSDG